ncbi:aminotransferase class V-fold PLP-dependent enzyme [Streptomyces sp. WMMB 322]|uniref:aminotransferase class V-fold PLP-dependent enzyme n=1 Tax=Streptomyces sp. WMMB 322 TaxID=1286821 RepID=UPI000823C16B|nr:aminotransferase class V-fold PLP-dependent enzyme [Streptomyces sp. WMMB 322]SCK25004.1 Selenocysteine lyase/Cysteine desulfurase [Streptomyces sp. WMMB 322]
MSVLVASATDRPAPSRRPVRQPASGSVPASAPLPVLGLDVPAPLATGGELPYAALDYAASAPVLRSVWEDVAAFAPYYGSVHRGAGHLSQHSTALFERSRATVARFLGCRPADEVVFTRSTTDSLNLLASALPEGTSVFVFETEHHASLLPWRGTGTRTVFLDAPRSPGRAVRTLERALASAPGGPKLVCVTGASNVTGEIWPVRRLAAVAHRYGARIVLDAAQLVPHRPVHIGELDVDWVAFSGHKLYAPFGAGVLAGRTDWLNAAEPYLAGGGASRRVAREADGGVEVEWQTGAARHEAGSPNVIGACAVASACDALTAAGFAELAAREGKLTARLLSGLSDVPGVKVLSLFGTDGEGVGAGTGAGDCAAAEAERRVGVVSFVVEGWNSSHLAAALSAEYGIGVRDGLFCAHPLVRALLGSGSEDSGGCGAAGGPSLNAVRVSIGAGTPDEHVERFVRAVGELVRYGARLSYRTEDGRCVPEPGILREPAAGFGPVA